MLIWKALIFCWSLLIYERLKVTSKGIKEKCEQGIHGWYECSKIYLRLVRLMMELKWQANVMRMRHDMLLHSLKLGRLVIWGEYYCTREASKRKVNETWVDVHLLSQIGKLHMKFNGKFKLIKKISCMTYINVKFKVDG